MFCRRRANTLTRMSVTRPLVLGHRGSPQRARENTLEAFSLAREDGADGVELDVHRTYTGGPHGFRIPVDRIFAAAVFAASRTEVTCSPSFP